MVWGGFGGLFWAQAINICNAVKVIGFDEKNEQIRDKLAKE